MYKKNKKHTAKFQASDLTGQIDSLIKQLAEETDRARSSEIVTQYLDTCSKFYNYSPYNQLLIMSQNPSATLVAGYVAWTKLNRHVMKGQKGIAILCPCTFKKTELENGVEKERTGVYFKVGYVYDVDQTEGEDLPPAPEWKSPERNAELMERLANFAKANGIKVEVKDLPGEIQGSSSGGTITLSPDAGTKTFIHELAHEFLHHGVDKMQFTADMRELQAESVAYVVAKACGLNELASPNYLALWDADGKTILGSMQVIRETANKILSEITPEAAAEAEPA